MKTRNSHGLLQLGREALAYCQCASALISRNKALLVSVDLIGEKNQVILEFAIFLERDKHILTYQCVTNLYMNKYVTKYFRPILIIYTLSLYLNKKY